MRGAGLSATGVLASTGVAEHLRRLDSGEVSEQTLAQYALDLTSLRRSEAAAIPVDFWDVRTPTMAAAGFDEYRFAELLARRDFTVYTELLGSSFNLLKEMKEPGGRTAVATALEILVKASAYVRSDHLCEMTRTCPSHRREHNAIFLWQQLIAGTNRKVPIIHRDAYTHGMWARCSVAEMWRYQCGERLTIDAVWGLTGFSQRFIGDETNTNQIEHLSISALSQMALGIPVLLLDILEVVEWSVKRGTKAAGLADQQVNRAVARYLLPHYRLDDPVPACRRLEEALRTE